MLCGDCCIEGLSEHHEQLLRALEDGAAVELDLSGITKIDTAGLQLVLAFVLEMKQQGKTVAVANPSEAVAQGAQSSGLVELLGL